MSGFSLTTVFILWVCGISLLFLLARDRVCTVLLQSPFPAVLNYYLVVTPLVLVEEYLTCELPYFSCIRVTLIVFWIFYGFLFLIQRYLRASWQKTVILAGILGWICEFAGAGRWDVFFVSVPIGIVLSILCFLIYAVLTLFPAYYLDRAFHPAPPETPP